MLLDGVRGPRRARSAATIAAALTAAAAAGVTAPVHAQAPQSAAAAGIYDVRAFGARGDGTTLDTEAINRAIDAAAAAGGGTVRFPAGSYLSFSIHLKSNIALYLDQGATIVAATPSGDAGYDPAEPNAFDQYQDFGHSHWHDSLIWGENLENVSILGPGRIWGKGLERNAAKPPQPGAGYTSICLKACRNVILRDVTIRHGGWFGILATGVDNMTVDNLKIDTNRDGMDIDCCRDVHITNCSVNSPRDDGICLKSSYGLGYARATENVTIADCHVSGFDEGTMLDGTYQTTAGGQPVGRIKFGTESNGGFQNIAITNCVFDHCRGLALETVDGAHLEDVTVSNLTMRDIVNAPIFLRLGRRMRGPAGAAVGVLRHVAIHDVLVDGAAAAAIISGIPDHAIEDVTLRHIRIAYRGGGTPDQAAIAPPELETGYPEPSSFGPMPAYGFFVRNTNGITFDDVHVTTQTDDARPAFVLNDVRDPVLFRVGAAQSPKSGAPRVVLNSVENLHVQLSDGFKDTVRRHVEHGTL